MVTLYQIAAAQNGIVGTGNKVEDFGVVFIPSMVMAEWTYHPLQI